VLRRHEVRSTREHELDPCVVDQASVLDRRDARFHGGDDSFRTVRVRGDLDAVARRFVDD